MATGLRLPDGSRIVPELVVGPFGAAVIEELPPAGAVMSRGVRSWEVRVGNGQVRTIENPLERATRDSRAGPLVAVAATTNDHVIKVYAAVVGNDPRVERSGTCAVLAPDQVAEWLTSLPPPAYDRRGPSRADRQGDPRRSLIDSRRDAATVAVFDSW